MVGLSAFLGFTMMLFGEYRAWMQSITGDPKCICAEPIQTTSHLLFFCAYTEDSCKFLTVVSKNLSPTDLFGTTKGLKAVGDFISHSVVGVMTTIGMT
jgi:hypothetical protein